MVTGFRILTIPFLLACTPAAQQHAVTATIGTLLTAELGKCIEKSTTYEGYTHCADSVDLCAVVSPTVEDFLTCAGGVK